jgi:hypothetical protein
MAELSARRREGIVETVVAIVHLVNSENGPQAALVEAGIMGDEGNGGYLVPDTARLCLIREESVTDSFFQLLPDHGKDWGIGSVALSDAMHPLTKVAVVVRLWLYQTVERINHPATTYHHHSHGADTRRMLVGRLKVDGYEVTNHGFSIV